VSKNYRLATAASDALILAVNLLIESSEEAHKDRLTCKTDGCCCGAAVEPDDVDGGGAEVRDRQTDRQRERERHFRGKKIVIIKKERTVLTRARHSRSLGPLVKLATARRRTHIAKYIHERINIHTYT